jgi:hypothetical protein
MEDDRKVPVMVRMDEGLRDRAKLFAKHEQRSLSNYLEALMIREEDRRMSDEAKLDVLLSEVRKLCEIMHYKTQADKEVKEAKPKSNEKKRILDEVFALELPETLSLEVWKRWVIYRVKQRYQWDVETAKGLLDRWEDAESRGSSLDDLVELAMQRGWKDAVYEKQNQDESKPNWYQVGVK